MLNIFICEDSQNQLQIIKDTIEKIILIENYDMKVVCATDNPYEFERKLIENHSVGIYFLDINLEFDINGFDLAEFIKKYDPYGYIIFITIYADKYLLTIKHGYQALGYIVKRAKMNLHNEILDCLKLIQQRITESKSNQNNILSFKILSTTYLIAYKEIISIETNPDNHHRVILYGINSVNNFPATLSKLEERLDSRFFRINRTTIINTDMVKQFSTAEKKVIMKITEQEFYVARNKVKLLNKKLYPKNK